MNLSDHHTRCRAGARAWSPLAPVLAPAAGAGDALLIARKAVAVAEEKTPVHPYLARQMLDFGFRKTLEVRTLGCARRFRLLPTCTPPPR